MVSVQDSQLPSTIQTLLCSSPSSTFSTSKIQRSQGRSMRTIRSNLYRNDCSCSFPEPNGTKSAIVSENLTESVLDFRLTELVTENNKKSSNSTFDHDFIDLSQAFSDYSAYSSDISGELQRLAGLPSNEDLQSSETSSLEPDSWLGFLKREELSSEIFECNSPENLEQSVKSYIEDLKSSSTTVKRSAAANIRLLAKNSSENRAFIGESGAIPVLIPLLRCVDPWTQEHAVTALLNLSLHEENKTLITNAGAIKPLVYVLKTGTETSKQNAACALLNLSLIDDNKISIGACGAIPPLVSLLLNGSNRGKKDALTTLYKLCSVKPNKERAVTAGAVKPLVDLVSEQGSGLAEKAMVVLSSLADSEEGKPAIVEEGGIPVLVEAIEDGSVKGKEFAVLTLLLLCTDSAKNRGLLVREGGIPPLVALSQSGTARAKQKAETLLGYLREPRQEASSSSP
ncbi:Armadillo [Macleaya cordata]|uniref:Armadillo n=1 Tax=Macleaya cordata TaxID=56857 RepID=A0A200QXD3_MACCD|nr:Armadillo [Macleaya cordata]